MLMVKEVPATSSSAARSPKDELLVTAAPSRFLLSLLPSPLLSCFQSGMLLAPGPHSHRGQQLASSCGGKILQNCRFHQKYDKLEAYPAQTSGSGSQHPACVPALGQPGQRLRVRLKPGAAVSSFSLFIFGHPQ